MTTFYYTETEEGKFRALRKVNEKEAEEYQTRKHHQRLYGNKPVVMKELNITYKDGFKDGYNKANEWHKPSEKLPKECSLVLAYSFEDTEPDLWEFVTSDQWEWLPKRIVFCSNDQIRLWKEIVLPELPKEIEEND